MFTFFNSSSLDYLRQKLKLLYVLNVTDMIFTYMLLKLPYYHEVNPLLKSSVHSISSMIAIKGLLPFVLLSYIFFRLQQASSPQLKQSNILINSGLVIYSIVNIIHLISVLLLPLLIWLNK